MLINKHNLFVLLFVVLLTISTALVMTFSRRNGLTPINDGSYQKVSVTNAEQLTGFKIPSPTYLPAGCILDGIYVYRHSPESFRLSKKSLPPRPGNPFQMRYRCNSGFLTLQLFGGDTRNEEIYANTGGDIPAVFGLSGEMVEVNGLTGVIQTNLNEYTYSEMKIHSRLVWRIPYTSNSIPNLKSIFLALESDNLSTSELLKIAESIHQPD